MAFRKKYESILKYNPDVIVIQEAENIGKLEAELHKVDYSDIIWYGTNPNKGIAILTFNKYEVSVSENFNAEFEFVIPLKLSCESCSINMFCIWAMPNKLDKRKGYVGQIWSAINYYKEELNHNSILIGDFNSNQMWDHIKRNGNHTQVVNFLKEKDIVSVYHYLRNIEQGKETEPTLYLLKKKERPYHIDYCFASSNLIKNETTISIGDFNSWISLSDHMPLVVDNLAFK